MKQKYTLEFVLLLVVIAVSLIGFSSLWVDESAELTWYHLLHIVTSVAWLFLLLYQLVLTRQQQFRRHREVGKFIFIAGPLLFASLTLLSVNSAAKEAIVGKGDSLLVQNFVTSMQVGLLIFLAFVLRRNREVHASFLMSTSLLFMGIALFFTFISYVPGYKIEGPETFYRFAKAGQTISIITLVVGIVFFLKNWRTGWPWLLSGSFLTLNGLLQVYLDKTDQTTSLTQLVASMGRVPSFFVSLIVFGILLRLVWNPNSAKSQRA